jgi:hypothetical protein
VMHAGRVVEGERMTLVLSGCREPNSQQKKRSQREIAHMFFPQTRAA